MIVALRAGTRPTPAQIEPVVPVVLGLHGAAMCAFGQVPGWAAVPFLLTVLLGVVGLLGWTSVRARLSRALVLTGTALVLSLVEPALVPSVLQWYYAVATVYPLLLSGRWVPLLGPLTGLCHVVQVLAGSTPVPLSVAVLRAGVLTALGLATWSAGVAYRAAARAADEGRRAAEAAGERLEHAATHDELTGLANRCLLHRHLDSALAVAHAGRTPAAGPGPLQGGQRHARPPLRRRAAAAGRPADGRRPEAWRPGRPPGR